MSIVKRLSTTVFSRVDQLVRDIENHDAIVEASIKDVRRASAQAKVRLARVQADGRRLRERLENLRAGEHKWTERARRSAEGDRDTALECVRRRRECEQQAARLESSIAEHEAMELRLADQVAQLERRVGEISEQRHLMRTRQSTAEAMRALRTMDCSDIDVDDTFERWNVSITEAELETGSADTMVPVDRLEKRFLDDETRAELESELDALCPPEEGSDNAR